MRRGQGNRHFQISKAIFMEMRTTSNCWTSRAARWHVEPSQDEAPAAVSHPVEPTLPLRIARRIDHSQPRFTDGRYAGEAEDVPFEPAYPVRSAAPSVVQRRRTLLTTSRHKQPRGKPCLRYSRAIPGSVTSHCILVQTLTQMTHRG